MIKKYIILLSFVLPHLCGFAAFGAAAKKSKSTQTARKTTGGATSSGAQPPMRLPPKADAPLSEAAQRQISEVLSMVRSGQCDKAAPLLYTMSRKTELEKEKFQIKYLLGSCLLDLKMYQVAAFQFVDVIRNGVSRYTKQSIEKLSLAADALGDDTLLNYAISKVELEEFPSQNRDIIYFRLGEIKMKNSKAQEAAELFSKVGPGSRYYSQARFNRGHALMEANHVSDALKIFGDLVAARGQAKVTDTNKVAAQIAIARAFYQAQQWDESIEAYRQIPRDSEFWHDALFESSWAQFRAAKFRSSLSNFQSLHSTYYEEFYLPESLLLRAIVYLYICKYDEMDKVLDLFEKTYGPVREALTQFMRLNGDSMSLFSEIEKASAIRSDKKVTGSLRIPYSVARSLIDEGDIKRSMAYLKNLAIEKNRIEQSPAISKSALGGYAIKVLNNRAKNSKLATGELIRIHMNVLRADLKDLFEQAGFIRYEMINGRKETLKKKIAGKNIEAVDDKVDRTFYVQNGYEYWPFDGEYWLDEIGNYHYLGKQSCE